MPHPDDIRMLVLDLDGTVLQRDRTISPRVRDAVSRVGRAMPVVIASARPPRSVRAIYEALGLDTPQISYNGALTWDVAAGRALTHIPLDAAITAQLIERARALVADAVLGVEHLDRWYTDRIDARFVTETGRLFPPDYVGPLAEFVPLGATKLMFHANPHEIDQIRHILEDLYGHTVAFIRTDPDLLQMMNRATSKWRAILSLAASLDIAPAQIMAIGDNENDVEMIREAGVGVAMANGTESAKAVADWIAPSNEEDGVAVAIERFIPELA